MISIRFNIFGPRIDFSQGGAHVEFLNAGANAGGACVGPHPVDCGQVQWFDILFVFADRTTGAIGVVAAPSAGVPEPGALELMGIAFAAWFGVLAVRKQRRQIAVV